MANLTFFDADKGARAVVKEVREQVDLVGKLASFPNSKSAEANKKAFNLLKEAHDSMINTISPKVQNPASNPQHTPKVPENTIEYNDNSTFSMK